MLWRLPSVVMTAEEEQHAKRLGYWLRRVREQRGETQTSAALACGLSAKSGSTVSMWEHGQRPITVAQLRRLAHFYRVPEELFIAPPMTDDERLADALADAATLERQDWEAGSADGPAAGGGRGAGPRTLH